MRLWPRRKPHEYRWFPDVPLMPDREYVPVVDRCVEPGKCEATRVRTPWGRCLGSDGTARPMAEHYTDGTAIPRPAGPCLSPR